LCTKKTGHKTTTQENTIRSVASFSVHYNSKMHKSQLVMYEIKYDLYEISPK